MSNTDINMIPRYDTELFTEVWDEAADFKSEYLASPFAGAIHSGETQGQVTYPDNVTLLYYMLYARYGNNPIANMDINQWKFKIFNIIYMYGPTWQKRLDIQKSLRDLSEDDLITGTKAIHNTALNPETEPTTSTTEELDYINTQNTTNYKKSKMDAYAQLWELLDIDVTNEFIMRFRPCFKNFVRPEKTFVYVTEEDEDDD